MGVIGSLVFLILPGFTQYFLYVSNETLSLLASLYFSTIVLNQGWLAPPSLSQCLG